MDTREIIKQFNLNVREYVRHRGDEQLSNIQRSLQILSATSDPNIFDFTNKDIVDFFVNLHELMYTVELNSSVMWAAVSVLLEACHNSNTRERLIHTFKFTAILTKLLKYDKQYNEKNVITMKVLQELTYGIKISWQEAHLGSLISILTKWIVDSDQELILLSLGVLVNLCFKNVPAVYTLMRSVDIKKFIKIILKLQRNNDSLRVQVCKLLIILQDVAGGVPDPEICIYIKSTCPTLIEGLRSGSACLMRHVVSFFKEIVSNPKSNQVLSNYKNFGSDTEKLLSSIKDEDTSLECICILMDYFCCIVKLDIVQLEEFYPRLLQFALRWVSVEDISKDSLKLISCIVSKKNSLPEKHPVAKIVINTLEEHISVILLILESKDIGLITNEKYDKLTALLRLLSKLLKEPKISEAIISSLKQIDLEKLFLPLKTPLLKDTNLFQEPIYTFFVQALYFLTELAEKETSWFLMYRELLRERQLQMVLSVALYTGPEEIKKKVLALTGTTGFSTDSLSILAGCMFELNKLIIFSPTEKKGEDPKTSSVSSISPMDINPLMTVTQEGYLNNLLERYENAANKNDNLMTSSLIELYQFKIASLNQNLRCMQTSQEAADLRSTRLQHSLALTSSEVSRLHQLLHIAQQSIENNAQEAAKFSARSLDLESQIQSCHNKYEQVLQSLKSKTRIISEQNEQIDQLKSKINENENIILQLKDKLHEMDKTVEALNKEKAALEESLEKTVSESQKENENNLKKMGTLKKEIMAQSDMITELQKLNAEKETEIANLSKELLEQKRTRERILEVAMGKL
ncbi:hypothetical protein O3M35_009184 [Rhynocoris fuscipes]|uniref:CIP2A N-terminal domain-containing protein n=1 Tax=Rhynocoris fuscipes TaxID=488301 RepID=A0AAW1D500_9HEMI